MKKFLNLENQTHHFFQYPSFSATISGLSRTPAKDSSQTTLSKWSNQIHVYFLDIQIIGPPGPPGPHGPPGPMVSLSSLQNVIIYLWACYYGKHECIPPNSQIVFCTALMEWIENTSCFEIYWLYSIVIYSPKHIHWEEIVLW